MAQPPAAGRAGVAVNAHVLARLDRDADADPRVVLDLRARLAPAKDVTRWHWTILVGGHDNKNLKNYFP